MIYVRSARYRVLKIHNRKTEFAIGAIDNKQYCAARNMQAILWLFDSIEVIYNVSLISMDSDSHTGHTRAVINKTLLELFAL